MNKKHYLVILTAIVLFFVFVCFVIQFINLVPAPEAEYIKITPAEAQAMMTDSVIILDVRTKEEYKEIHIENAVLLPDYEVGEKAEHILIDKNQTILVYCRTGRRSELAARILIELGYTKVYDFGGLSDWNYDVIQYNRVKSNRYNVIDTDYIVEPFITTITQHVHPDLSAFEFRIEGNTQTEFDSKINNPEYWHNNTYIYVYTLTITNADNGFKQVFTGLDTSNHLVTKESPGISFNDWNFDGYLDISLWKWVGGTSLNAPQYFWLWDNDAFMFVRNEELEKISDYSYLETDTENRRFTAYSRDGAWVNYTDYYEFRNGKAAFVKGVERYFDVTNWDEYDESYADRVLIRIYELINGEKILVQEYFVDGNSNMLFHDPPQ